MNESIPLFCVSGCIVARKTAFLETDRPPQKPHGRVVGKPSK